jgi:hypothetical protein
MNKRFKVGQLVRWYYATEDKIAVGVVASALGDGPGIRGCYKIIWLINSVGVVGNWVNVEHLVKA